MVTYDPNVIQQFADALYARARSIVIRYTLAGALIGLFGGGIALSTVQNATRARLDSSATTLIEIAMVVLAAILGLSSGRQKAFELKLQAQEALCQLQIEANSRPNGQ